MKIFDYLSHFEKPISKRYENEKIGTAKPQNPLKYKVIVCFFPLFIVTFLTYIINCIKL